MVLVHDISFAGDMLVFEGLTQDGRKAVVCQHYSRLNYTIMHGKEKTETEAVGAGGNGDEPARRTIGFKSG